TQTSTRTASSTASIQKSRLPRIMWTAISFRIASIPISTSTTGRIPGYMQADGEPMSVLARLDKRGQLFWVMAGFILVVGVWAVDVLTGPEIAVSIFYLIPIVLVAWFAGRP